MVNPTNQYEGAEIRQHSDSVILWVLVLAGSLLIHLFVILAMHLFLRQVTSVQIEPAPISVEFFNADTGLFSTPPSPSVGTALPQAASAQPSSSSPSSSSHTQPSPELSPPQDPFLFGSGNNGSQTLERSPTSKSPATPKTTHSAATPATPSPAKPEFSSTHSPPPNELTPLPTSAPPDTSSTDPVQSGIPLPGLPSVPNPSDNPGLNNQTTDPLIKPFSMGQNAIPASFSAQIKRIAAINTPDAPDYPATIQGERSKTFSSTASGCLLIPAAVRSFGQSVVLRVPVDENGNIDERQSVIQQSSGNNPYDQLAICSLKHWSFEPAYTLENGSKFDKPSNLEVEVVITQR
ncbi:MAG: hypothetical protein HC866_08790 [Leptolyngbyaceae cyanobacterium RU_5_1]|nr:hypothetical protein [Leptolyngbyaceae cyanobacterium RU_5_1]